MRTISPLRLKGLEPSILFRNVFIAHFYVRLAALKIVWLSANHNHRSWYLTFSLKELSNKLYYVNNYYVHVCILFQMCCYFLKKNDVSSFLKMNYIKIVFYIKRTVLLNAQRKWRHVTVTLWCVTSANRSYSRFWKNTVTATQISVDQIPGAYYL